MDQKEWTIMIYMAGDNNLAVDMAYAMGQIKEAASKGNDGPNVFVYYDGNSPSIPTLYCDFSDPEDPRFVRSVSVPDKLYPSGSRENENAADMRSIYNFVDWCLNKVEVASGSDVTYGRRANRYALILSGHSLGFQDIGLFRDEGSGKSMKMSDLKMGLERLIGDEDALRSLPGFEDLSDEKKKRETTNLIGQKLDILGFDSCVMGMLEVGYQFKDVAKRMIASEGSVPSAGWTYANILSDLASRKNGDRKEEAVAEQFVQDFIKSQDTFTIGGISVDIAAWELGKLRDLAKEFSNLSQILIRSFEDPKSYVYRHMERAILQVHWKSQSYMYDQNVDLGDFCELLARECSLIIEDLEGKDTTIFDEVRNACNDVIGELREVVLQCGFSGGAYQYSNGISVFFPWSREGYDVSRSNYESLWISKDAQDKRSNWTGFLEEYLFNVALRKFEPIGKELVAGSKYRYQSGLIIDEDSNEAWDGDSGRLAGREGTKLPGREGTKLAGREGTKLPGREGTRLPGREGTRLPGREGTRLPGREGTKLAGLASNQFFDLLQLFKNVESHWNVSGFTKKPKEKAREQGG